MPRIFSLRRIVVLAAGSLLFASAPSTEGWSQTMKFVISVPPGGPTDVLARVLAENIGQKHGVNVIVENRPGGDNAIAVQAVAHATPDGNTVMIHAPAFLIAPQLGQVVYDPFQFEPICNLVSSPVVLAVNASSPYRTLADLIDAARAKPGELTFGSVGPGSPIRLGIEMLKQGAHVDMTYVPFRGDGPTVTALLGGHITAMLGNFAGVSGQISAGKLRALAVGSRARIPALPDVPTVAESGYKDYEVSVWFGAIAPAGTPKEKVDQLREWFGEALKAPEVTTRLAAQQLFPVMTCGAEYTQFLRAQFDVFGRVIRDAKITVQ